MNILEKINLVRRKNPIQDYCIQTIRFIKLLENSRVLLDLIADGDEKSFGEYILDGHYVITLIDSVIERLGMMVHDACVLVPSIGKDLYCQYDNHKKYAKNLLTDSQNYKKNISKSSSDQIEPEYKLLANVLEWLHGDTSETVMNFIKYLFLNVIQDIQSLEKLNNKNMVKNNLKAIKDNFYLVDLWLEPIFPDKKQNEYKTKDCLPLKYLLMETGDNESGHGKPNLSDIVWLAAASEFQLSLNTWHKNYKFRLDAISSGHKKSDFIFTYANLSVNLKQILPEGFHIETTKDGQLAWNLGVSPKTIEDNLMFIGQKLFTENKWRV